MSKLLEPFTNFLRSIGIDPLLFAIIGMLIIIFISKGDYKNWKEQSKRRKEVLVLTIMAVLIMIVVWIVDKLGIRSL